MATTTVSLSQTYRVENYLLDSNRGLTAGEARQRFGVKNLRAVMSRLREGGYNVDRRTTPKGVSRYFIQQ